MTKNEIEAIKSLGRGDKLTVQKSLPLFALWQSDLTLAEFKILDIYLSRINSHRPDQRVVTFEKGELEKILQVQKINNKELKARLKHLMGNVVEIPDTSTKQGFRLVTLFEEAVAEQDDNGLWQVKMECTQKAMRYFFFIENLGYLRYKLRCITSIRSRYTYIMFIYLESNRFRKSWEVPVEELKEILNCDKEETYKDFKRFNDRLLKRVQKEMHEKTECRYKYEPVKKGRSVVAIRFTLSTLSDFASEESDDIPGQMSIEDLQMPPLPESLSGAAGDSPRVDREKICAGFSASEFDEFTDDQLALLKEIAWSKKSDEDVERHNNMLNDIALSYQYATSDYLRRKVLMAKAHGAKNLFRYVQTMIENE